jgi:hypothetical protein
MNLKVTALRHLITFINNNLLIFSLYVLSFISAIPVSAAKADTLFLSDEIIKIELKSDFTAIQKDRSENPVYHEGELIYYSPGGNVVKLSIKIMARGNFRRDPKHCDFPPLFVNFKKNEVKNTIFENQDKLKLVTHCIFEEDLIEEYLVYKLYNQITDLSFKVRLAKITYFDTALDKKLFEKYSFFLEDKDHVAERNNASEKDKFLTPFDLNQESYKKLSVFQYMIGNKDWFVTSRKNIVIMQPDDTSNAPYAVPYDFDFSGFVNAAYTKPKGVPEDLLSERRVYKGLCYTYDEIQETVKYYQELKPVFKSIIKKQKLISGYTRKQLLYYIDQFYVIIESGELIKQEFMEKCETKRDYNISE